MRDRTGVPAPVDLSVRLYTRLLAAYPGTFRAEYAGPMAQVFRDVCRRDYRRGGLSAMAGLWARTSLDLIRTTVEEHIDRGLDMTREKFVRWSGWALIAGAVLFAAGLALSLAALDYSMTRFESSLEGGMYGVGLVGEILIAIGLLGLLTGYAERHGGLGTGLLVAAIVGLSLSVIGLVAVAGRSSETFGWSAVRLGLLAHTVALSAYGAVAVQRQVFSRWNFAPLLAGVTALVLFANLVGPEEWMYGAPIRLAFLTMCLGMALLGYRMQADAEGIQAAA